MPEQELPFQQQAQKQEKKGSLSGLFSGKKEQPIDLTKSVQELTLTLNNIARRTRVLEEGYTNIRKKLQVMEQNALKESRVIKTETHTINSDINDVKRSIDDIKSKMLLIIKELKVSAKREDIDTLQKYINLWEPVNFVTQNEVEKIVRRVIEEIKYEKDL